MGGAFSFRIQTTDNSQLVHGCTLQQGSHSALPCQQIRAVTFTTVHPATGITKTGGRPPESSGRGFIQPPAGDQGRGSASAPHRAGSRRTKKSNMPTADGADRKSGAAGSSQADEPGPQTGQARVRKLTRQGRRGNETKQMDKTRRRKQTKCKSVQSVSHSGELPNLAAPGQQGVPGRLAQVAEIT